MLTDNINSTIHDSYVYLNNAANNLGSFTYKVFNINGRIVKKFCQDVITDVQQLEINFSDLGTGTYIINAFKDDTFVKAFKFTKV